MSPTRSLRLVLLFCGAETGSATMRELLAGTWPGGLLVMGQNVESGLQLKTMIEVFQGLAVESGSPVRLFVATDQEGGTVQRIETDEIPAMPSARTLGDKAAPDEAARLGAATADALLWLGVNMNLTPVADVAKTAVAALRAGCALLISTGTVDHQVLIRDTIVTVRGNFAGSRPACGRPARSDIPPRTIKRARWGRPYEAFTSRRLSCGDHTYRLAPLVMQRRIRQE